MTEPLKRPLHEREILVRDSFTTAETAVYLMILLAVCVSLITADPRSFWLLGTMIILAPLSIANTKLHELVHPFQIDHLWLRYGLLLLPAILIALQYMVGIIFPTTETLQIKKEVFIILTDSSKWLPVSTLPSKLSTTLTLFGFISIFVLSLSLFIVPKSIIFFRRLLPKLCFLAVLAAVIGYLQKAAGLSKSIASFGTGKDDFFAFFPYDGHWAAFACLWAAACAAISMEYIREDESKDFLKTNGSWYLFGAVILGSTGLVVHSNGPGAILLLLLSFMLLATAIQFIHSGGDRNHNSLTLACTLGSCLLFAAGIFRLVAINPDAMQHSLLRESALELFLERPLFGWGFESFPHAAPFFNNDNLGNSLNLHAQSDFLHYLSEFGLFGCLVIAAFILILSARYFRAKEASTFSNHLLIACLSVFIIATIDSPFMSPTVTLSFWVLFFSALRYATIKNNQVDEVDVEDTLMVSPSEARRIPFFTGEQNEKEI